MAYKLVDRMKTATNLTGDIRNGKPISTAGR